MNRNAEKLEAIEMLEIMIAKYSYAKIRALVPSIDDDGILVLVEVKFDDGGIIPVIVEGLSPLGIVRKIIEKAELG